MDAKWRLHRCFADGRAALVGLACFGMAGCASTQQLEARRQERLDAHRGAQNVPSNAVLAPAPATVGIVTQAAATTPPASTGTKPPSGVQLASYQEEPPLPPPSPSAPQDPSSTPPMTNPKSKSKPKSTVTSADLPNAPAPQAAGVQSPLQPGNRATTPLFEPTTGGDKLQLGQVIQSVYATHPMIAAAYQARTIAAGDVLQAEGGFDLKLKAETLNQPLGFYETYRHSVGAEQPLLGGGSIFGGYRNGRGSFEPWYQERSTNHAGEFKAGAVMPLLQNRAIDERRTDLWTSQWAQQAAEPGIQTELIEFVRQASFAYWDWVAAGRQVQVSQHLLSIAEARQAALKKQVERGDKPEIDLTDNQRLIVSRQAKLIEAERKVQLAAIKLSLYHRDANGTPLIATTGQLPDFPLPSPLHADQLDQDIQTALAQRPETRFLDFIRQEIEVERAQAENLELPQLDAVVTGSQDIGEPTSKKRDKSEFELEAGLQASVPLQRRKARGKQQALDGKLAQLSSKRQFVTDKINTEVRAAHTAVLAAYHRYAKAHEATQLAEKMEVAEERRFELGETDLLSVNLRETQTADAASTEIETLLEFHQAEAAYRAAMATDVTGQ